MHQDVLLEIGAFRDGDDDGLQCAGGFYLRRSIGAYCLRPKRVQGFDGEFVLCAGCAVWNLQAGEIEKTFNRGIVSAELREVNTRGIIESCSGVSCVAGEEKTRDGRGDVGG